MIVRRMLLSGIAACALAGGLLLTGCGGDDPAVAGIASTVAPEPLPIDERVVKDGLAGLTAGTAPQVASTPEAFARLVGDDEPAEEATNLREAGFVTGALTTYAAAPGEVDAFGLSGAIEYGSPEQARSELARLDAEFAGDSLDAATPGTLARVPGSRTITASGTEDGQAFALAAAFFTDGPFLYVQSAFGPRATVRPGDVFEAAGTLYEWVKGRPAPTP